MPVPTFLRGLLRTTPTLAPIHNRSILSVSGSQATEFLNGLLASSLSARPCFSAFLHAQGRVLYDVFVYTQPAAIAGHDSYLIEHDASPSEAPALLTLLKRYVLRSKVRIRDVSAEYDVWAAWGSEAEGGTAKREWDFARSGAVEPVWRDVEAEKWPWGTEHGVLNDSRACRMGKRMLVAKGGRPQEASTHDIESSDAYLLHRIMHGVPEGSIDIQPMQAFPMESNLDLMGGLDFRKGCYVGQELTVRTYHTGAVRKRILPVIVSSNGNGQSTPQHPSAPVPPHLSIRPSVLENLADPSAPRVPRPRGTGTLLSTVPSPTHGVSVGLGLLRLEQVEAAEKGSIEFTVEMAGANEQKEALRVQHWWPDWWPTQDATQP
ncbi:Aminomethyltransferase folate-binding domain-containing protein [Leucogyrophana mollusca]|uniref:Aminomethyltransferase folate-binding domain-containing protein n=1 Tax=Leucogyrophana mollusca TaxID=85980 RepID=A0ACB8BWQ3_9AGAM|nr:Aminomethyltransferase folate-binding domain-containing protein [Leucogyrophana mollusca]